MKTNTTATKDKLTVLVAISAILGLVVVIGVYVLWSVDYWETTEVAQVSTTAEDGTERTVVTTESYMFEIPQGGDWFCGMEGHCGLYKNVTKDDETKSFHYDFLTQEWTEYWYRGSIYDNNTPVKKISFFTAYDRAEEGHIFVARKNEYYCIEARNKFTEKDHIYSWEEDKQQNQRYTKATDCLTVEVGD
jgi:hypothetical protein